MSYACGDLLACLPVHEITDDTIAYLEVCMDGMDEASSGLYVKGFERKLVGLLVPVRLLHLDVEGFGALL